MSQKTSRESLSYTIKMLILKEPFYGHLISSLNKNWSEDIPTACVGVRNLNYELTLNPAFWEEQTENTRKGLIKHELLHLVFFHLTDDYSVAKFPKREILNYAMDLEVNQYIQRDWLPAGGLLLEHFPELKLEEKKGTIYYYKALTQADKDGSSQTLCALLAADKAGEKEIQLPKGVVIIPKHEFDKTCNEMGSGEKKVLNRQTQKLLEDVASRMSSPGSVPGEVSSLLDVIKKLKKEFFDWKGYLRHFLGQTETSETRYTRRKPSRRIPGNPAMRFIRKTKVLVAVDTSASVSDKELIDFQHEMNHIKKAGYEIHLIQCDTQIANVSEYNEKVPFKVYGRGGTSFQPVVNYFDEHSEFNCLLYFTDGEASVPKTTRKNLLWILTSNGSDPGLPGKVIKIPKQD